VIVDCETRIWDLRDVDMAEPGIARFWDKMMEHGRILTRERAELQVHVTGDDLIAMMDRQGIDHACVTSFAFNEVMGAAFNPDAIVVDAMQGHPDRITGYASANPTATGIASKVKAWAEMGFAALSIYPPEGFYPDDRDVYPFYEACVANGIRTVFVHTGLLSMPQLLLKYAQPTHLDAAARDFPEINFVAEHFGYPWENDLIAVAWKHSNVYICSTYLAASLPWAPGDFYHAYGRALRDIGNSKQVVWGSDWVFWTETSVTAQIQAIRDLQMPDDLRERYGYPEITDEIRGDLLGNAARAMLRLPDRETTVR
jgi:predicted TIM-barrel fold metal-dependent hydrolase